MDKNILINRLVLQIQTNIILFKKIKNLILTEMKESSNNECLKDTKNFPINKLLNLTVSLSKNDNISFYIIVLTFILFKVHSCFNLLYKFLFDTKALFLEISLYKIWKKRGGE